MPSFPLVLPARLAMSLLPEENRIYQLARPASFPVQLPAVRAAAERFIRPAVEHSVEKLIDGYKNLPSSHTASSTAPSALRQPDAEP